MSNPRQYVAAKAIIRRDGKILVLRQSDESNVTGAGRYHPPGGIVEPGETLHEALLREVAEETGLEVTIGDVVSVEEWRANIRGEECQFVGIYYVCTPLGAVEIKLQAEEATEYEWVDLGDLADTDILEPSLTVIKKVLTQPPRNV